MAEGINTTSITLPESTSDEIWAKTLEQSAVMRLATPIDLPGNGLTIPVITGEPAAEWVSETDEKPVSTHTLATKNMKSYTLAVIEPFSNQFRDNWDALYNELANRLPNALARKFDQTVFFGTAPGTGFDTLAGVTQTVNVATKTYDGFVDALGKVSEADANLNGWALSPQARTLLLKAKDSNDRPLFVSDVRSEGSVPSVLGIPATFTKAVYRAAEKSKNPETIGFGGDWTGARYGVVRDISLSVSDQATLSTGGKAINLWQRNMFAVRCEFEVGFIVRDVNDFVRIDNGTTPAA